jgi:DNA-binding NarL/FixJ family response regulator
MNKNILIVDDSSYFRSALADILASIGNVNIVGQISNGCEMLALLDKKDVDIVFIDIKLPGFSGIESTKIAHNRFPKLQIIGFSSMENPKYIHALLEAGANGFLSKNKDNYDLIKQIVKGEITNHIFSEGLEINKTKNVNT